MAAKIYSNSVPRTFDNFRARMAAPSSMRQWRKDPFQNGLDQAESQAEQVDEDEEVMLSPRDMPTTSPRDMPNNPSPRDMPTTSPRDMPNNPSPRDIPGLTPPTTVYGSSEGLQYRAGGPIQAPKAPPGVDNVQIMARDGEYVLPEATVQALGGIEVLDRIVAATTGQAPGGQPTKQSGLEGFAAGGPIYGPWRPVQDIDEKNQERRQRAAFGRDPMAIDPKISDAVQRAFPVAKTSGSLANLKRDNQIYMPEAIRGLQSGVETAARVPGSQINTAALDRDLGTGGALRKQATAMGSVGRSTDIPRGPVYNGSPYVAGPRYSGGATRTPVTTSPSAKTKADVTELDPKLPFNNSEQSVMGLQPKPGPGDNIRTQNVRGIDFNINELKDPKDQAQYGRAIISAGRGIQGATKVGFDRDIKDLGQGAWDPSTGKGVTFGTAKNPGKQLPATAAATNAIISGTQAGRDSLARESDLNAIKQWAAQPEYTPITETTYSQATIPGQPETRQTMPDMRNAFQREQDARGGLAYEAAGKSSPRGASRQPSTLVTPATPDRQVTQATTNYVGGIHRAPRPDWLSDQLDMPRLGEEYDAYRQRKLAPAIEAQKQQFELGLAAIKARGSDKSSNDDKASKAIASFVNETFDDPIAQNFSYSLAKRLMTMGMDPYQSIYQSAAMTNQALTPEVFQRIQAYPPQQQQEAIDALMQEALATYATK